MAVTQPRMQEFLRHHFLFQTLNEKALSEIIERSAVMGFTPDKDILHEGSECKGFYIIFSGKLHSSAENSNQTFDLVPGDLFRDRILL